MKEMLTILFLIFCCLRYSYNGQADLTLFNSNKDLISLYVVSVSHDDSYNQNDNRYGQFMKRQILYIVMFHSVLKKIHVIIMHTFSFFFSHLSDFQYFPIFICDIPSFQILKLPGRGKSVRKSYLLIYNLFFRVKHILFLYFLSPCAFRLLSS